MEELKRLEEIAFDFLEKIGRRALRPYGDELPAILRTRFEFLGLKAIGFFKSLFFPRTCENCGKKKDIYRYCFKRKETGGYLNLEGASRDFWFAYCRNCTAISIITYTGVEPTADGYYRIHTKSK